jgi:hypothetical protein
VSGTAGMMGFLGVVDGGRCCLLDGGGTGAGATDCLTGVSKSFAGGLSVPL